jgi:hypothetical protein
MHRVHHPESDRLVMVWHFNVDRHVEDLEPIGVQLCPERQCLPADENDRLGEVSKLRRIARASGGASGGGSE